MKTNPAYTRIKKVISRRGKVMYYVGDGLWFGRISKKKAEEGLASGKYTLFETVDAGSRDMWDDLRKAEARRNPRKRGGRGLGGKYKKGARITDIKKLKTGMLVISDNKQFNSLNMIKIVGQDKTGLNRGIVYGKFYHPDTKRLESNYDDGFAIWDHDISKDNSYGNAYYKALKIKKPKPVIGSRKSMKRARTGSYAKRNPEMSHEAYELFLYIENDGDLYRQQYSPINKNLVLKKLQGKYNHEKAVTLFKYLVDNGAKKYAKEFDTASNWNRIFSVADRKEVARELRDKFETKYEGGEFLYPEYIPKKYRSKVNMRENPLASSAELDFQKDIRSWERRNLTRAGHYKGLDFQAFGFPYKKDEWVPTDKRYSAMASHERAVRAMEMYSKKNPPTPKGKEIYSNITAIEATKGKDSLWPDEPFRHDFKHGGKILGLPNGDLLIKKGSGKKLWKNFQYGPEDGTRNNPATKTSWKNLKWFIGYNGKTMEFEIFKSKTTPTRSSHGKKYDYTIGPFDTKTDALHNQKLHYTQKKNPEKEYKPRKHRSVARGDVRMPYKIKSSDVGRLFIGYGFGVAKKIDVGKKIHWRSGIIQMENTEQMKKRKAKRNPSGEQKSKCSKFYLGVKGKEGTILPLKNPPTQKSHGHRFTMIYGPFTTKAALMKHAKTL